jgi:hypothetical protein
MIEPLPPAPAHEAGHESKDVNFNAIFGLAGLVIVLAVAIHLGIWFVFQEMRERQNRGQSATFPLAAKQKGPNLPPPPQLEGIERMQEPWGQPRPQEPKLPSQYEWVDRKAGIASIPIDRAIALIVERKLIPSKEKTSPDLHNPYAGLPSPANSGRPPAKEQP